MPKLIPHLHYPYSEEIMDYADAHGIVVIDETAAVGINAAVAAVLGTKIDGQRLFLLRLSPTEFREAHARAMANSTSGTRTAPASSSHPCCNRPKCTSNEAVAYSEPLYAIAKKLDPHRPRRLRQRDDRSPRKSATLVLSAT